MNADLTEKKPAPEFLALQRRIEVGCINLDEVLGELGVAQTTWWRWSKGHTEPRLRSIRAFDNALRARGA